jgi:hypothetical protein
MLRNTPTCKTASHKKSYHSTYFKNKITEHFSQLFAKQNFRHTTQKHSTRQFATKNILSIQVTGPVPTDIHQCLIKDKKGG